MTGTMRASISFLAAITLRECQPAFGFVPRAWRFPCGLVIADELLCYPVIIPELLLNAHLRHHTEGHTHMDGAWTFNEHVERGLNSYKITVSCGCET